MITFPRAMPTVGALSISFEVDRVDYLSPEAGGRVGGVTAGQPLWRLVVNLQNMERDNADVWRAWLPSLRGSQRPFYGFDVARRFPKAHRSGFGGMVRATGGAFDGSATSWSETLDAEDNSRVTLNGLPSGLALNLGDYIGFKWDDAAYPAGNRKRRALVRVVEAGVASAGGSVSVTSEPPVPLVVPAGAIAHLDNPACVMKLLTADTQIGEQGLGEITAAGSRIAAVQDLRA